MALARLQSTFLAAVTHEFKSPLTAIRLLMERVTGGRLSGDGAARYYTAMASEIDRLEGLVNRLLDTQRLHTGRKQYARESASMADVVREAVEGMRAQAEARRITVATRIETDLPALHLDVESMSDAVRNLIDNAIKYSHSGATVDVTLASVGAGVALRVADEGVGVDPDEAVRLFEPFYRGKRGDRANVQGTGLGLALVKATAEAHGGRVTVAPRPTRGSCFTMTLPTVISSPRRAS